MSVNYDRVCRLCLSSRGELLPIFPTTSSDVSEPHVLASKIKDCVAVQINENDDLPTNACRKCVDNVNNWHVFKTVCERTQNKLQSLIKKDGSQLEEVNIKSEPLSDEAYDDGVVIDGAYHEATGSSKLQPEGPPILASLGLTPRSDKTDVDPRMDWHRVQAILALVRDDDVIDSLQSSEECDIVHQSEHKSDSDIELEADTVSDYPNCDNEYLLRNGKSISKTPLLTIAENNAKIKDMAKLRKQNEKKPKFCPQPRHAWQLIFTNDLLDLIVSATNDNICQNGSSSYTTNISEIRTMIGILYFHGIMRPTHQKLKDLWHMDYGVKCITNAMGLQRFIFLLRNISFCNNIDNDDLSRFDIMKRMRKVFEIFASNCRSSHHVENTAVVDEILVPVFGPAPFRYVMKNKPIKTGLKMVLLVDPVSLYIGNLDVVTDSYFGVDEIVNKLVLHLTATGRVVIMNSWFSSINLIEKLQQEYRIFCIAALRNPDENIPPFFLSKCRKAKPILNGFLNEDLSLTSQIISETKAVNVLTSDPRYYKKNHNATTSVVNVYKKNQSAVEVVDVLMHYYTTMQHTNSWMMSMFFSLLNIASVNAQVIWSTQDTNNIIKRRLFIQELALSLMNTDVLLPMSPIIKPCNQAQIKKISKSISRKRCKLCMQTTKRDRRTKQYCMKCSSAICKEHTIGFCTLCAD